MLQLSNMNFEKRRWLKIIPIAIFVYLTIAMGLGLLNNQRYIFSEVIPIALLSIFYYWYIYLGAYFYTYITSFSKKKIFYALNILPGLILIGIQVINIIIDISDGKIRFFL